MSAPNTVFLFHATKPLIASVVFQAWQLNGPDVPFYYFVAGEDRFKAVRLMAERIARSNAVLAGARATPHGVVIKMTRVRSGPVGEAA